MGLDILVGLRRDPAAEPPDDSNTKEGVLNPVILLRRHQEEGSRTGPRGRPELSTSIVVQRSQTVLVPPVTDGGHDVLLRRGNSPVAIGKGDLFSRDPTGAEVRRGGGEAPIEGRGTPTKSLDPVTPSPPKDLGHGAGKGGHVGRGGPGLHGARREPSPLER